MPPLANLRPGIGQPTIASMTWQFESQLIVAGVLGLALLWLRALRLERPAITGFELQRQLKMHDKHASRTAIFVERLPALQALRDVLALACMVVALATVFA